jgi:hypothetical protein
VFLVGGFGGFGFGERPLAVDRGLFASLVMVSVRHFPVWPHRRYAEACASGAWPSDEAVAIDIDDWVQAWLPDLENDGMRIAVFQTPADEGVGVTPDRMKSDLEAELEQFEL